MYTSSELTYGILETGAVVTSFLMTPFDVVKTRLQAQQKEFMKHKCYLYCNGLMEHVCYLQKGEKHWFNRPGRYKGIVNASFFRHGIHCSFMTRIISLSNQCDAGTLDAFMRISASEGISSLWSGLPPTLVMAVPATVLYFTSYDMLKDELLRSGVSWN